MGYVGGGLSEDSVPCSRDYPGHGARVGIVKDSYMNSSRSVISHISGGNRRQVLVRSYKDGIRVGCTFVTNEALEEIYRLHSEFLKEKDYVTHQEGY
jgi:hypothetical protein